MLLIPTVGNYSMENGSAIGAIGISLMFMLAIVMLSFLCGMLTLFAMMFCCKLWDDQETAVNKIQQTPIIPESKINKELIQLDDDIEPCSLDIQVAKYGN